MCRMTPLSGNPNRTGPTGQDRQDTRLTCGAPGRRSACGTPVRFWGSRRTGSEVYLECVETNSDSTLTDADQVAIREVVANAAAAQVDPLVLPELHTPGAVIVNIAGRRVLGRDAFAAAMAAAVVSPLRDVRTSVEVLDVRPVTGDVALVSCRKTVHDERGDEQQPALPTEGAMTYVMARTGDGWQIALAQTTPMAAA